MVLPSLLDVDRAAPALLDVAVRSVVFLGLAGGAALVMRRASAAARHWVWLLGVAGLLMLPVLAGVLPGWNVLPRMAADHAAPRASATITTLTLPDPVAPLSRAVRSAEAPVVTRSETARVDEPVTAAVAAAAPVQAAGVVARGDEAAASPAALQSAAPRAALSWTAWAVIAWTTGSLLVLGQMMLGYLSLWSLQRRCAQIREGAWPELLSRLCQVLNVRRTVELLSSTQRTMPMTWGLWRTRLLLPVEAGGWPLEQRRAVLLHELGHVRRWDCVAQLVAQMACALYWFNPLVWVAWRRMQVERERACDDLVLNTGARASAYAEHLLHSASAVPALRFVGAAVAMARPSTLEERLKAILDPRRNRRALTLRGTLATVLLLVAALVPVAALHAQGTPARGLGSEVPLPPGYLAQATPEPAVGGGANVGPATRPALAAQGGGGARGRGVRGGFGGGPVGGIGGGLGGSFGGGAAQPALGDGPTCTLDATIYDVRLPVDKIGQLDVDALTRAAATAATFEKALSELGTARPLYRADQSVRLAGDDITIGTQTPYITSSQMTTNGQEIHSVSYTSTGAIFSLAGKTDRPGGLELDLSIQVSSMSESTTPIAGNVNAPVMRHTTMSHKGPVEALRPFVVVSIDAASVDADGKAVAYIARVTLGQPQSTTAPARGE